MSALVYTRFELRRTFRNRRFMVFSLGFPLVLYFLIATPNRDEQDFGGSGISVPLYYMVGLAAFGTMNAMLAGGSRIATERALGWNRQLRITPLSPRWYLAAKVVTGYAMALVTIVLLDVSGISLGVRLSAGQWVHMTALLLLGLVPFAALGILIGHVVSADSVGPVIGGLTGLLALVSGTWFPLGDGLFADIAQVLPSYWLVQASQVALGGGGWDARGYAIVAAWSVVLGALAARAYRRDTGRA